MGLSHFSFHSLLKSWIKNAAALELERTLRWHSCKSLNINTKKNMVWFKIKKNSNKTGKCSSYIPVARRGAAPPMEPAVVAVHLRNANYTVISTISLPAGETLWRLWIILSCLCISKNLIMVLPWPLVSFCLVCSGKTVTKCMRRKVVCFLLSPWMYKNINWVFNCSGAQVIAHVLWMESLLSKAARLGVNLILLEFREPESSSWAKS